MAGGLYQLSLHQITDDVGVPIKGNLTFFYEAATLDPIPVWTDQGCTVPASNPVVADGTGRVPAVYISDVGTGYFRIRCTTPEGMIIPGLDLQTLPVAVPGGGGGAPPTSPVSPTTLLQTGMHIFLLRVTPLTGFVRANGGTIGNATSGASEMHHSDALPLFQFLYSNVIDALCPVSGGRSGNSTNDFAGAKRLTLPDMRGRAPFGLDTMGAAAAAGRLTAATINAASTGPNVIGSFGGVEKLALTVAQLPAHGHPATGLTIGNESTHTHGVGTLAAVPAVVQTRSTVSRSSGGLNVSEADAPTALNITGNTGAGSAHTHGISGSVGNTGSSAAHNSLSPALLGGWFIKI